MDNKLSRRPMLFLTELILDLFIFIICAVVCVGLLIKAHGMSTESVRLTEAAYIAQQYAEQLWTGNQPQQAAEGEYTVNIEYKEILINEPFGRVMVTEAEITVSHSEKIIYSLIASEAGEVLTP